MPFSDPEAKKKFDLAWARQRRQDCIDRLGGRCAVCGSTEQLHFDHIDAKAKVFAISRNLNRRWDLLVAEVDKCQLLCNTHHHLKSQESGDYGGGHNKLEECPHGTLWGYTGPWKCRCSECRAVKAKTRREYKLRRQVEGRIVATQRGGGSTPSQVT